MTKTAAEVEMEVEATRGKLDRTMEALKDKMTPGLLIDEASHAMGGIGEELLSKFMEQAKENPMPLALMGVGLVWLMAGSKKSEPVRSGNWNGYSASGSGIKDKMQHLGAKAASAQDTASDAIHHMGDKASDAVHDVGDKASDLGHQAVSGVKGIVDREPLLLAAVGLVVGVALAAALPSTSLEDQTVGSTRDDLLEKGKALASDSVDKVTDTAQAAYGAVKSELGKGEQGAGDLSQRIGSATQAGVQAAKDQLSTS
jgi:hypothetical protein